MKTITIKLDALQLDPNNARTHSASNLTAIANSLTKFGQRKPIVITEAGLVLAGNGTVAAAQQLGWTELVATVAPKEWDAQTAKAYAIADNRTAELAEWDNTVLAAQLIELDTAGWDIGELGFEKQEPTEPVEETQPLPEPPIKPETELGDLYQLGEHLLLCGDATNPDAYTKLLSGTPVDLVWTDPPYGVAIVGGNRADTEKERLAKGGLTIENDNLNHAQLTDFLRTCFTLMRDQTKKGACWYITAPSGNLFQCFSTPLTELEIWKHTLVWVKDSLVMGRADYHYRHEAIFYGWTQGAAHQPPPNRKQDTVWEIPRPKANKEHPTMKPIELITRAINNSTNPDQLVLDPFGGSGSTLIACEQTNRKARLMELDPKYCDVIIKRWENLTGQKAVRI
jgi:site-specific DNA-methyltransferase (adenine-specific)